MFFLKLWLIFCLFYNSIIPRIVEFTGHLLSDAILLAVREWERKEMGITSGNGNKTRLNMGSGMMKGMNHWEREKIGLIMSWAWPRHLDL